jgi:hypothetical protein
MAKREHEVIWFEKLVRGDVSQVGGKNASLGEVVAHLGARGVAVPPGFADRKQFGPALAPSRQRPALLHGTHGEASDEAVDK